MIKTRSKRARAVRHKIGKRMFRLSIFRSNRAIYAQVIDDSKGETIAFVSSGLTLGDKKRMDRAYEVGATLAKELISKKVKKVVFDRGPYRYHGLVKAVADGAREGGLEF